MLPAGPQNPLNPLTRFPMPPIKKIKKVRFALPSLVTLGSVFCAMLSMSFVLRGMMMTGPDRHALLFIAALAVLGSILFDLFDGKIARWTHTSSRFGMELDSLADAVSFGVSPAVLMYGFALHKAGLFGLLACFLYTSGALLRLARFNIEADDTVPVYFKGIPSPAGAAGIAAIVLACIDQNFTQFTNFELNTFAAVSIFLGILMVSNVRYKALKGKKTRADIAVILIGILFFAGMAFFQTPALAFLALFVYFILWGMLLTAYLTLKHEPAKHREASDDTPLSTPQPDDAAE